MDQLTLEVLARHEPRKILLLEGYVLTHAKCALQFGVLAEYLCEDTVFRGLSPSALKRCAYCHDSFEVLYHAYTDTYTVREAPRCPPSPTS